MTVHWWNLVPVVLPGVLVVGIMLFAVFCGLRRPSRPPTDHD